MAGERFEAKARIPTRPLDFANKDLAFDRELLVDYTNHAVYIYVNGEFHDITSDVTSVVNEVIKKLQEDPTLLQEIFINEDNQQTIINNVNITLENGDVVSLNEAITDALKRIEDLEQFFDFTYDEEGNITNINIKVEATDVEETEEKQFVSQEEKEKWDDKADIFRITATIMGGTSAWEGSKEPYTQVVNIPEILESDYPVVDVVLSEVYQTAMDQLNSYAYIYKILTFDGYIKVFASNPTEVTLQIQMKVDR